LVVAPEETIKEEGEEGDDGEGEDEEDGKIEGDDQ